MNKSNYLQGRTFLEQNNPSAAQVCFQSGADLGDPKCIYGLVAVAATTGVLTSSLLAELESTIPALMALAQDGDAEACFIVARCSQTGSGMPQDPVMAVAYYIRAASLGDRDAMFNLGCFYMQQGPEGETSAVDWFQKAADAGCPEAKSALEHYYQAQ